MEKEAYAQGARLAEFLAPLAEVAIYEPGESEAALVLNQIFKDTYVLGEEQSDQPFWRSCELGRSVKSQLLRFSDGGCILLSLDLSPVHQLSQMISVSTHGPGERVPVGPNIQDFIDRYFHEKQLSRLAMNRDHKKELVQRLYKEGLFDIKEAVNLVADYLDISRATIYNYINWAKTLGRVCIHQVDTCTDQPFHGNPAAVVLDAETLSEDAMRKISRGMKSFETAFVMPSHHADFQLRFFTPTAYPMRFCGHSTVAALFTFAREQRYGLKDPGRYQLTVETPAGILPVAVAIESPEKITVAYQVPPIKLQSCSYSRETLCGALGISVDALDSGYEVMVDQNLKNLFLTVPSLETLQQLEVDTKKFARFCAEQELLGACLLSSETIDPENHVHSRVFCPLVGVPEDAFTGSIQGALAAYVHQKGLVAPGTKELVSEQGHILGRPGLVRISLEQEDGEYTATVEAKAVHFFSTEITLI